MNLLVIEDDKLFGGIIEQYLSDAGYLVDWIDNSNAARAVLNDSEQFDLVILDLELPGFSWQDWIQAFRKSYPSTPVLALTANHEMADILKTSMDGYLSKRFCSKEKLFSSIQTLLSHTDDSEGTDTKLCFEDIELDLKLRELQVAGKKVKLIRREFELLRKLLEHPNQVVTKEALIQSLYGWDNEIYTNTIEVHIHQLRRKLGAKYIKTVYGMGDMLTKD